MPVVEVSLKRRPRRRLRLVLLVLAVTLAHVRLIDDVALSLPQADAPPPRIEVAFVRELAPTVPPPPPVAAPPRPKPPPVVRQAPPPAAEPASAPPREEPPAEAASAAQDAASAPSEPQLAAAAEAADAPASAASADTAASAVADAASGASLPPEVAASAAPLPPQAAASAASPPPQAAASAASAPAPAVAAAGPAASGAQPDWPPATQLDFELLGWYRGEVYGSARVQWLRQDRHYQVHLDVTIGPGFAPLMSRRMSSDGEVTARGLAPRRYDEETKVGFLAPRRTSVLFETEAIVLGNGSKRVPVLGVQDTASQFVQMTWMFTMQPALLKPGGTVELPLALPKRLDTWIYDVLGEEVIDTPLGRIPAVHLRPRIVSRSGEVMTVEAWFAPTLQYLPVRLLIRQSAEVWADLKLKSLPLQSR